VWGFLIWLWGVFFDERTMQSSPRAATAAAALARGGHAAYRMRQLLKHVHQRPNNNSSNNAKGAGPAVALGRHPVRVSDVRVLPEAARASLVAPDALGRDAWLTVDVVDAGEPSSQARKVLFALRPPMGSEAVGVPSVERVEAVHMAFRSRGESPGKAGEGEGDNHDNAYETASGHRSVCISSQAGCALKCAFCATGRIGLKRQLTADEITDQVLYFLHAGEAVDTVSFMGMGEPLANPRTFDALRQLTSPEFFGMSPSRINVSTVGIIPGIRRLTAEFPRVNLAFSMHSPFSDQRSELVPNNKTHPLEECWAAVVDHVVATRRQTFVAYLVFAGFNDSDDHARAMAAWIERAPADVRHLLHVNLLRYNPAEGILDRRWKRTSRNAMHRFRDALERYGVQSISTRQSFGVESSAACGQLYGGYEPKP
jgi:23S rRNA (adenine-C8)-methyltransferase